MTTGNETKPPEASKLELSRIFDAPRARVFAAWTEPEQMKRFWGPEGYTIPMSEADLRLGGAFRYTMRSAQGREHMVRGLIAVIEAPARFVTASVVEDEEGVASFLVWTRVDFADEDGRTRLDAETHALGLREGYTVPVAGMRIGWTQQLDRLEAELALEGAAS
jgi:uncharacterized protein YndB with AHSA1/START domain